PGTIICSAWPVSTNPARSIVSPSTTSRREPYFSICWGCDSSSRWPRTTIGSASAVSPTWSCADAGPAPGRPAPATPTSRKTRTNVLIPDIPSSWSPLPNEVGRQDAGRTSVNYGNRTVTPALQPVRGAGGRRSIVATGRLLGGLDQSPRRRGYPPRGGLAEP